MCSLLPGWKEQINDLRDKNKNKVVEPSSKSVVVPYRKDAFEKKEYFKDSNRAENFVQCLECSELTAVALDTEFRFSEGPLKEYPKNKYKYSIRSVDPLLLSVAAGVSEGRVKGCVLDLHGDGMAEVVRRLLSIRVPFIFHNLSAEFFCFWKMGLDCNLPMVWDTMLAGALLENGVHHRKNAPDTVGGEEEMVKMQAHLKSLIGQAERRGIEHRFAHTKSDLQESFLDGGSDYTKDQIDYAYEDARVTLMIYLNQVVEAAGKGLLHHLYNIEFPYARVNARMQWEGVRLHPDRCKVLREASMKATERYLERGREFGVENIGSPLQVREYIEEKSLAKHFVDKQGKTSTADDILEKNEFRDPLIPIVRKYRKYKSMSSADWLTGELVESDGRVHPEHKQASAATGRNSCARPHIVGVGKIFRPVVVPEEGNGIFEVDYSQMEVVVAAAESGDPTLMEACRAGDVYSEIAKELFKNEIEPGDEDITAADFKSKYPDIRSKTKPIVLGVIYNRQAASISAELGVSVDEGTKIIDRFFSMYPRLKEFLDRSSECGGMRGHATTITGLRRYRHGTGSISWGEKNWLVNTPIQGSAADIFKYAVVLAFAAMGPYGGIPVLPVHDALVVECPLDTFDECSKAVVDAMKLAALQYYPNTPLDVDINDQHPECWNKDGHADSIDRWLEDPFYSL